MQLYNVVLFSVAIVKSNHEQVAAQRSSGSAANGRDVAVENPRWSKVLGDTTTQYILSQLFHLAPSSFSHSAVLSQKGRQSIKHNVSLVRQFDDNHLTR
jgi:hypothetical protein